MNSSVNDHPPGGPDPESSIEMLPTREVFAALETRPEGLTAEEARERLERFGPNLLREVRGEPLWVKFLANFIHLMAILLWIAGAVALMARMPQLAVSIWAVNLINGAFSFWQEYKAEKATEAMRRLLPVYAQVLRDGKGQRVPAQELVPGDVLILSEGDRISADARLVEEAELRLDQSTLTGESVQVRKTCEATRNRSLTRIEIPNIAFTGTNVVSGTGKAVVFATGMETEFGKIAGFTQSLADAPSPLQREMQRVTKMVTAIAVSMGGVFFLLAVVLAGVDLTESFIFGMGMIVAFVPEGLLPTVTLSLAMGVQRMARRNALIKRLSSVETLGSASVICTDKTGTLTQNEMTVRNLWLNGRSLSVTGTGYVPEGEILETGRSLRVADHPTLHRLLVAAGLCNNARLLPPEGETPHWTILGDPTEGALRALALKAGVDLDAEERRTPRLHELPFESRRKRMSTLHGAPSMPGAVYAKGAPREILGLCTRVLTDGTDEELDEALREQIMNANDTYARNGLRVLAVGQRVLPPELTRPPGGLSTLTPEAVERDLTFLGLIAMMDPPRPEVSQAVAKCHQAGIRIIMITGDYGLTAESIARRIGILREARPLVVSGADLDAMDDAALQQTLQQEVLFARAAPDHKLRVVAALQRMEHVVAVTGDGVNDAPALKKADIGVAMGLSGTDVAREASDMILLDDNFASIVNAIEEGRTVYSNIKKFSTYIFTSNTPEAAPFILFALSRSSIPLALNVMHILTIDLGTDLVPALGLGAEPPEPGIMDSPPRSIREHVITPALLLRAYLFLGPLQSLAVMAAFYFQYWTHGYWGQWLNLPATGPLYESATAMALACVVTTQIGNLFAQRTERSSVFQVGFFSNRLLWVGILSELLIILAVVYLPFLQSIIGTRDFSPQNWLFLFAWAPLLFLADEGRKALLRWRRRRKFNGGNA
ncbi:cation-transporting P-type ATPase [Desulforhabdus sp. TSK]|uniref:cation-translocating P-type ATPase n=1 Tax=Desulforhabdus sp. TSK TaxID=2925014 RepID=UPI001FC7D46C|nr:cation-transporting P-type ATPase [Desulforhabdus sp. TSK]GKT10896.1 haloacid dehalogenase [Desulforhabdus sp. TSK]